MKKILIFSLPGIGNTLLIGPMLKVLREHFKDAKIVVLVMYPSCKELLEGNPNIDEIVLFEFLKEGYSNSFKFLRKIRNEEFDISILPHPSNELYYTLVSYFSGARIRVGHEYTNFHISLFLKFPYIKMTGLSFLHTKRIKLGDKHEVEENLDLIKKCFGVFTNITKKEISLHLTKENRDYAAAFLKKNDIKSTIIGLHPGSSNLTGMENKRWPKEKFAELSDFLIKNNNANILVFGGKEESDLKNSIYNLIKEKKNVFIVSVESIKDTAALIEKCNFFITNDSGLMHIAAALNVKTIAISGAVDYRRTYPWSNNGAITFHDIKCYPCYRFGENLVCKRRENDYACLKYISIYNIILLIERMNKNEGMGPILERV